MKNSYILDDCSNTIFRAFFTFKSFEPDIGVIDFLEKEFAKTYPELPETSVFKEKFKNDQNKIDTCLITHKFFSMMKTNRSITKTPIENQYFIFDNGSWRHSWLLQNPVKESTYTGFDDIFYVKTIKNDILKFFNGEIYLCNENGEEIKGLGEGKVVENFIILNDGTKFELLVEKAEQTYKAGRPEVTGIDVVFECVEAVCRSIEKNNPGNKIVYKGKMIEADDIIGMISKELLEKNPNSDIFIFSNDEDMDQNATNGNIKLSEIKNLEEGNIFKLNPITKRINELYGRKSLLLKIIVGDSSDNIANILPKIHFNNEDMDKRVLGKDTVLKQFEETDYYDEETFLRVKEHVLNTFCDKFTNKIIKKRKEFFKKEKVFDKVHYFDYTFKDFMKSLQNNTSLYSQEEIEQINTYLKELETYTNLDEEELEALKRKVDKCIDNLEKLFYKISFNEFYKTMSDNFDRNQKIIDVKQVPSEIVSLYENEISPFNVSSNKTKTIK